MKEKIMEHDPAAEGYLIKPCHIDASRHLWASFGNLEAEASAGWIVRLCQRRGNWGPFTYADIDGFYREQGLDHGFNFNSLLSDGHIKEERGVFRVTHGFVTRCFGSSPDTQSWSPGDPSEPQVDVTRPFGPSNVLVKRGAKQHSETWPFCERCGKICGCQVVGTHLHPRGERHDDHVCLLCDDKAVKK